MSLVLIGCKSAGKTTYGTHLANMLKVGFYDTDHLAIKLFEEEGKKPSSCFEIVERYGENYFRTLETKTLKYLQFRKKPLIISAGGGTLFSDENLALLRPLGKFVYLKWSEETIKKRILSSSEKTIYKNESGLIPEFSSIHKKRAAFFDKIADVTIACEGMSEIEILHSLKMIYHRSKNESK